MNTKRTLYAIIDIETTGGKANSEKITEIAIVIHDGEKIVDSYETLLNPERNIPYNITNLTGINNEMVANAPKFYEVAKKIVEITENTVFVAHNVRFDYGFVREEFARLGFAYTRKCLCTVRLSRQYLPGIRSYSLGNLIKHFNIKVSDRHRAMADVQATVVLFEKILALQNSEDDRKKWLHTGIKESNLPANISLEKLQSLPEECGVYYLYDSDGDVIYVGKSIDIRRRVTEHFADQTEKAATLQRKVHDFSYEITGSELVALLLEDYEIKRLKPSVNKAQRKQFFPYGIFSYTNLEGFLCFFAVKNTAQHRKKMQLAAEFPTLNDARAQLKKQSQVQELCQKLCHFEGGEENASCFLFKIKQCTGACCGQEAPESYNLRAIKALDKINAALGKENFILLQRGRTPSEFAAVLIENGKYCGFGFVEKEEQNSLEDLKNSIKKFPNHPDIQRLIRRYLSQHSDVRQIKF